MSDAIVFSSSKVLRALRSRALARFACAAAVVCVAAIEVLHGHECCGDGCLLCLAAGFAHVLLLLCVGVFAAQPVLRAIASAGPLPASRVRAVLSRQLFFGRIGAILSADTPLSMKVVLRI